MTLADVIPRVIALSAGAIFGFLFFGVIGAFIGALVGILTLVALNDAETEPG